jgi:gliding motility-associated-like protein
VSSLTETLTNTISSPIEVVYQLTATSVGCSKTSELKVTVEPSPSAAGIITGPTILCSGSVDQEYSVPLIPNATSYEWTLPTGAVITSGLNTNRIKVNFGSGVVSGNVVVKGVNSCGFGQSTTLPITIVPSPTLSSPQTATLCSGSEFTYTPISSDSSTTFRWSRTSMIGISNPSATGTGIIVETLINTTGLPINVVYEYELENAQGCISIQQVTLTIKPTPNLIEPTLDQVACSGSVFTYTPSFSLPVTTFNWTRVAVEGITPFTPPVVASVSSLTETLTNTTSSPIEVVYQLTATSVGCSKTSELKVTVEPSPSAAGIITGPTILCSGSVDQEYSVPLIPNATSYEWTLPTGAVITSGLNTNRIKVNFGSGVVSGNVVVKGVNSCGEGIAFSLPVTIYQNAMVSLVSGNPNTTLCIGSSFVTPIKYAISPSIEVLKLTGKLPAGVDFTSSTGIITGTPTESGSFPFTITSTSNCSNSLSGIIVVNPLQSIAKLSGTVNQIVCINTEIDPIIYSIAKGTTGVLINPVLPLGIVVNVDEVNGLVTISGTPTVATSLAQNYVITTQGSCGSPASTTISFDIKPAVILDFISPTATLNQAVCLNGPIIPIRFSVGGGATGIITPVLPTGLTISQDPLTLVYTIQGNPTANGTFTIPITTTGCTKTEIITISNVNTAVSIDLLSALGTDQQTLCQSNFNSPIIPIQYTMIGATSVQVLGLPAGVTFVYNPSISELIISGTPTQTGIFNYTITSLPCSIIKTGVLKVSIPMFISNESVKNVSCNSASNGEISVNIIGGVPLVGQYSVHWSGPNGFQQNQLNIKGLQAGDYILTGRDAVGCLIPSKTYTVLPASPILISLVSTTNVTCNNALGCANLSFTGGTGTYTNFNLQYLDSSLQMWATVPNPTNNYFNICNLKAGLYRIAVTDSNSCTTDPFQFTIYDYSMLKIDGVNLDNALCTNANGKVRVTISSLDHNLAFFYNGVLVPSVDLGSNKYELSIASPTAPSGIIKVTNSQNCWDSVTVNTSIVNPQLIFTSLNLTNYGNISVNESVKFTNGLSSSNIPAEYDYIVWDFGDNSPFKVFYNPSDINLNNSGESITTAFHTYAIDGLYPVTLTVYNHFGCSRSISKIVTVGQGAKIMLPTAFSPNNDGINDLFRPSLLGLKEVSMYIYDNWGNLIYEVSSDTASLPLDWGWNGIEKVNSEPVNGTYRYYIMAKTINDTIIEKEGQFILIK